MEDKKKKDADLEEEEVEEAEDVEEEVEDEDADEDEEVEETPKAAKDKKKSSKDDEDEEEDDLLEDEESKSSFGMKIVFALVVIAIIALLLLRACTGKTQFNVTLDLQGGTASYDTEFKVDENGKITRPADPTKEGYDFAGWYYNDKVFDFNTKVTSDIKLVARWTEAGTASVTGVTLNETDLTLAVGATAQLIATVAPENAKDKSLTWTSSDTSIVTVDGNGNITALKEGTVTITVTTNDGSKTATCKVTVSKKAVPVTGVSFKSDSMTVPTGYTKQAEAVISPSDATNKGLTWTIEDTSIASVNSKGVVTGKKEGKTKLTVTTSDGKYTATIEVVVKDQPVTGVSISGKSEVTVGKTIQLTANVKPSTAKNKKVTWSIKDGTGSATINQKGVVTGKKAGTVTVTVTTEDGKYKATKKITVKEAPTNYVITLTPYVQKGSGSIMQYGFAVTKDGKAFTAYESFTYNGHYVNAKAGTIPAQQYNSKTKTAKITLTGGKTVTATVKTGKSKNV